MTDAPQRVRHGIGSGVNTGRELPANVRTARGGFGPATPRGIEPSVPDLNDLLPPAVKVKAPSERPPNVIGSTTSRLPTTQKTGGANPLRRDTASLEPRGPLAPPASFPPPPVTAPLLHGEETLAMPRAPRHPQHAPTPPPAAYDSAPMFAPTAPPPREVRAEAAAPPAMILPQAARAPVPYVAPVAMIPETGERVGAFGFVVFAAPLALGTAIVAALALL